MTESAKQQTPVMPRLKLQYQEQIRAELKDELGLANINQVPELKKVVVSSGVGRNRDDKRYVEFVTSTLAKITGQTPAPRHAKKSIATFKIRKGPSKSAKAWGRLWVISRLCVALKCTSLLTAW